MNENTNPGIVRQAKTTGDLVPLFVTDDGVIYYDKDNATTTGALGALCDIVRTVYYLSELEPISVDSPKLKELAKNNEPGPSIEAVRPENEVSCR